MANAYVMRTNMSVAIVAMVNHTAIEEESSSSEEAVDDECDAVLGNVSCYFLCRCTFSFYHYIINNNEPVLLTDNFIIFTKQWWSVRMEDGSTGLYIEFIFLWLCYHSNSFWITIEEIRKHLLLGCWYADQLAVWFIGSCSGKLRHLVVDCSQIHTRTGWGE